MNTEFWYNNDYDYVVYYLCQGGYVLIAVWLSAGLLKNYRSDLDEMFWKGGASPKEEFINFWTRIWAPHCFAANQLVHQ